MTRARKTDKPTAEPLATKVRAALAQGWHTLDALEALAGRATGARLRVHAALAELRAAGVVLEERVERGVAEVRLLTLPAPVPAPVPDDGDGADLDATIVDLAREAQEMGLPVSDGWAEASDELGLSEEDTERLRPVWVAAFERRRAEREEAERALDAPDPLREPSAPAEAPEGASEAAREPVDPLFVQCPICEADPGHPCKRLGGKSHPSRGDDAEAWAREQEGEPSATPFDHLPAPRSPGPSSRCADCGAAYKRHAESGATKPAPGACSAFKALPRGRPTVERPCDGVATAPPSPALDAPAVEPPPCPPCVDCGEERGTCPEGRCRDCDLDHIAAGGACRECHMLIMNPAMGARPVAEQHALGCSLTASDDWHPRNAAEYTAAREARCGWAPEPRRGCERELPTVRVAPIVIARPPRCPSVWHDVQCEREAGHPCGSADEPGRHHSAHEGRSGWTDEAAARWAQRRAEEARETARGGSRARRAPAAAPVVAPPCRPPLCHADDIHEPSRVRGFTRPLCERHRRWVEGAGGTVAAGGLAGVVEQVRAGAKETV